MIAPADDVKSSWKRIGHDTLDMFKAPAKRAKLSPTAHPTTSNTSDASDVSLFSPDGNVMNKTVPLRHAVIESRVPSRVEQSPSDSDKSDTTCTLGIRIEPNDTNSSNNRSRIRLVFTTIFTLAKTSGG